MDANILWLIYASIIIKLRNEFDPLLRHQFERCFDKGRRWQGSVRCFHCWTSQEQRLCQVFTNQNKKHWVGEQKLVVGGPSWSTSHHYEPCVDKRNTVIPFFHVSRTMVWGHGSGDVYQKNTLVWYVLDANHPFCVHRLLIFWVVAKTKVTIESVFSTKLANLN